MANEGATSKGVREMRKGIQAFPRLAQLRFRAVAFRVSRRVAAGARQRLEAQTKGSGATAAAIHIVEDADRKAFIVKSVAPKGKPANLPLWLEHGTVNQGARPYMGPAGDAESSSYTAEMRAASVDVATEAFG